MRFIFLDVDGVLNYTGSHTKLHPDPISRLKRIIDATNARVIVSSMWRRNPSELDYLTFVLNRAGISVYGSTPASPDALYDPDDEWDYDHPWGGPVWAAKFGVQRTWEIMEVVSREIEKHGNISFVAIDDLPLTLPGHNFIQTQLSSGLEEHHVDAAISLLTKPHEQPKAADLPVQGILNQAG